MHFHGFSCFRHNSTDITRGASSLDMLCLDVVPNISLICTFIMAVHTIPCTCWWIPTHLTWDQVVQNWKEGRIFLLSFHWVISVYSHKVHIQGGFGRLNSATDVTRIRAIRVFGFNVVDQATLIGCLEVAICTAEGILTVANHLALKIQPSLHFFPNCNT